MEDKKKIKRNDEALEIVAGASEEEQLGGF